MSVLVFGILLICERVLGEDALCETDSFSTCAPPDTFPLNFPENEIQLDASCSIVSQYMPCVRNHELSCHGSFNYEEQYNRVYGTLQAICREGSQLHEQLSNNLMCIKKILNKHEESCKEEREKITEGFVTYVQTKRGNNESKELTAEDWDIIYCLHHSFDIGCFLRNIEECETEAKEVSVTIIKSSGFILDGCPDDIRRTADFLFRYLDLQYYQEKLIKEVLQMSEEK